MERKWPSMEALNKKNQAKLRRLLRRLESHFGFAHDYQLAWITKYDSHVDKYGRKVRAYINTKYPTTIYIFTPSLKEAQEALIHEFIEGILLTEFTDPYNDMVNSMLELFEGQSFKRRERLVNRLAKYLNKELVKDGR